MDTHVANENKDEDKKIISFFKTFQRLFLYLYEGEEAVLISFGVNFDETNTTHFQFNLPHTSRCHTEMYSFIE